MGWLTKTKSSSGEGDGRGKMCGFDYNGKNKLLSCMLQTDLLLIIIYLFSIIVVSKLSYLNCH